MERRQGGERYQFLINNSATDAVVATTGVELISGTDVRGGHHTAPAGSVDVVRRGDPR